MRPTFLGFETARKGLNVNQKAIDVTGQNIVNINTEGYTRQRVDQVSMSISGASNRFATPASNLAGAGVMITGVGQIRDTYLDSRFREEIANTSYFDKAQTIIDGIESALDEVSSDGLGAVLNQFILGLQEFTKNPREVTNANIVMSSAKNVTQMLRQFDNQLTQLISQQKFDLETDVNKVNTTLQKIASLNKQISNELAHNISGNTTYGVNELQDQRNLLIDELSAFGNLRVVEESDGSVTISMNEHVIVRGDKHDKINLMESPNSDSMIMSWESNANNVILESGSLKASIDLINGTGGETKGVPYYREQIDLFARTFASNLNNAFVMKTEPATVPPENGPKMTLINDGEYITAGNIKINSQWLSNAGMIIEDAARNGETDTTNILRLIDKIEAKQDIGGFQGSLHDFVDFYNTTIGQDRNYFQNRFDASLAVANDLNNRRDAVSGVVLDEEGANLMMYEKAYQASSRLMTALDEMLDILINRTGKAGL